VRVVLIVSSIPLRDQPGVRQRNRLGVLLRDPCRCSAD
jgi:hypothetical protein